METVKSLSRHTCNTSIHRMGHTTGFYWWKFFVATVNLQNVRPITYFFVFYDFSVKSLNFNQIKLVV